MAEGRQRPPGGGKRGIRKKDLALVFGPAADGDGVNILRRRAGSGTVEAGTVRPLREGRAITGEVVHLEPREEAPFLFDCETDEELSTTRPPQQQLAGPLSLDRLVAPRLERWLGLGGEKKRAPDETVAV